MQAIASLERFARKGTENLETLSSLGILKYVLPLVRCEDYLVRRFAQKLIAQLCALEEFRQNVLAEDGAVHVFADILQKVRPLGSDSDTISPEGDTESELCRRPTWSCTSLRR